MKIGMMFSISDENIKKLKEVKNRSSLVDKLITDYFNSDDMRFSKMTMEELEHAEKLELAKIVYEKEVKQINDKFISENRGKQEEAKTE